LEDYTSAIDKVQVLTDAATRHDFALTSGRLTAPRTVTATAELGRKATVEIALTNTGDQPATYQLTEREGGSVGSAQAATSASADVPVQHVRVDASPLPGNRTATNIPMSHPGGGEWTDLANYPTAVEGAVVGVYDGRLYSFTGARENTKSYRYDPAMNAWTPIADTPIAREAASGANVGGRFVITGGIGAGSAAPIGATSIYDPATDTWTSGAPNPSPFMGAGTAVLDGKLYLVGGCESDCGRTNVMRYDPATDRWTRLADFPYGISRSACGGIGSRVYCAGGVGPEADGTATWAYTPATNTWQQVADLPQDIWGGGTAVVGDELVISGGVINHGSMKTNEGYAYDPVTNRWRNLPNRHYALFNTSGACGFFNVGGTDGERFFYPFVERLPGLNDCAVPAHIDWLSVDHPSRTVQPGHREVVRLAFDAAQVTKPGTYTATLHVAERTPYPVTPITVRFVVKPRG
jgi:N-acetylneuraminic acid mutarotase